MKKDFEFLRGLANCQDKEQMARYIEEHQPKPMTNADRYASERKRLAERLKQYHDWKFTPGVYDHSIFGLAAKLLEVDAVEVVHGEWLDSKFVRAVRGTNLTVVQCSKCECYFCDVINNHNYMYHYCPNCGAKMDGDENG